jgi:endonuclease-3
MVARGGAALRTKLARIVARLRPEYGPPPRPPAKTAFELVLWERVAYLVPDDRRALAFAALRKRVGLTPQKILVANPAVLREIAATGGSIGVDDRVRHMQDAAAYIVDELGGSLDTVRSLPLPQAKRALQRIYGTGEPGAEKILLFTRSQTLLPLDSNGLRTLLRIGYGTEHKSYTTMYRSVRDAARAEAVPDFDWLIDAHLLLRAHGQTVCKTSSPRCESCVIQSDCAFVTLRRSARSPSRAGRGRRSPPTRPPQAG